MGWTICLLFFLFFFCMFYTWVGRKQWCLKPIAAKMSKIQLLKNPFFFGLSSINHSACDRLDPVAAPILSFSLGKCLHCPASLRASLQKCITSVLLGRITLRITCLMSVTCNSQIHMSIEANMPWFYLFRSCNAEDYSHKLVGPIFSWALTGI